MTIPLIEGNDEIRAKKCEQAIKEVLESYHCVILASVEIIGARMQTGWIVAAMSRDQGPKMRGQN
jgi:hypothetical protein